MLVRWLVLCLVITVASAAPHDDIHERIMGGNETNIDSYPYAIQISYMDQLVCGGVLLSNQYALTAAHCVYDKTMEYFIVRAGTTTLDEGGQTFTISEIIYHPLLNETEDDYDAAILLLSDPVTIDSASAVQLAVDDSKIVEGATVIIVGWGWLRQNNNDEFSDTLLMADLKVLSDEDCKTAYSSPQITDAMFCAGYDGTIIRDFCYGDYGGPGVIDGVLHGIISFGDSCGSKVGVFVKIPVIVEWISGIISQI